MFAVLLIDEGDGQDSSGFPSLPCWCDLTGGGRRRGVCLAQLAGAVCEATTNDAASFTSEPWRPSPQPSRAPRRPLRNYIRAGKEYSSKRQASYRIIDIRNGLIDPVAILLAPPRPPTAVYHPALPTLYPRLPRTVATSLASICCETRRFARHQLSIDSCDASSDVSTPDPNLRASRTASASYPPKSLKSLPRPKESRASRRTNYPRAERAYPTRHPTHSPTPYPKLIPEPVSHLPSEQCAPNLAYFVTRTPSKELPVYQLTKRGGNMKLTRIRKIDGRPETLRDALRVELNLGEKEAVFNAVTRQVVLKGFWKKEVDLFLRRRMF